MLEKIVLALCCAGCCLTASAQTDVASLSERYAAHKRDIGVVKEYVEALEKTGRLKDAEKVVKEYMSRCPVLQLVDRDTYLLINKYVFADPYSNAFEYGLYAYKKLKWDRGTGGVQSQKSPAYWAALRMGVSGSDEIDKRYEAVNLMTVKLNAEIQKQCTPAYHEGHYVMPEYVAEKMDRLQHMVDKAELPDLDGMRARLFFARAMHEGRFAEVVRDMQVMVSMDLGELDGNYIIGILSVVLDSQPQKAVVGDMLALVLGLAQREERTGGGINYYNLLGRLYGVAGDRVKAAGYTARGKAIDDQRREQYKDLYDIFEGK